jgi:DNA-binding transcriptional ArsR family regulator
MADHNLHTVKVQPMNPYHAIADPHRRQMLDLLRTHGPLRAGEIVAFFPQISQPAVSKHLRVLREANLVRSSKEGREQWYHLDAAPLQPVAHWLEEYESLWSQRLQRLQQVAEGSAPKAGMGKGENGAATPGKQRTSNDEGSNQ